MNKYQLSLNRIKSIDLDVVRANMWEMRLGVSPYMVYDLPNLEMSKDINNLQELVDLATPQKPLDFGTGIRKQYRFKCPNCGFNITNMTKNQNRIVDCHTYCSRCGQRIDWSEENE